MMERRLWVVIAVVAGLIFLVILARRWSSTDPHAAQEIEKAKRR